MLPALLAASLAAAQVGEPPDTRPHPVPATDSVRGPFAPDTVLRPPGGPLVVLTEASSGGVAALRLAVPLDEGPAEAGVGHLLRDLAFERMESLARPIGARVTASRTPWGLAYAVEGSAADVEYLAYLLREAASEPDPNRVALEEARQALRADVARTLEAPGARVLDVLRRRVAPDLTATQGTEYTVAGLDAARVLEAWRRSHVASRMTLVVSAGVPPEVVLAATRGLGAPDTGLRGPMDAPAPPDEPRVRVQTLRTWYGEAWSAGSPTRPEGPVAALLVAESLARRAGDFEVGVELWELPDRWALAVSGGAYARGVGALRRTVSTALTAARDDLTDAAVAHAVARVRADLLLRARTPGGFVAVLGRALEAGSSPDAAARYLAALEALDRTDVERFLDDLLAGGSVQAEVRP